MCHTSDDVQPKCDAITHSFWGNDEVVPEAKKSRTLAAQLSRAAPWARSEQASKLPGLREAGLFTVRRGSRRLEALASER
jgi:hypothetical protein